MRAITPNLWFDDNALEAAEFYVSIFPNSRITRVMHYTAAGPGPEGQVLTVEFELRGQPFAGINGGPIFAMDESVSFAIECDDQAEADHYWALLTADGGAEGQCGWLKDKFGLSWQVYPVELADLLADPDPERASRATAAMLTMRRIDIAAIRAAAAAPETAAAPGPADPTTHLT